MKVLERYILGRAFVLFFGTLAATLVMVWIVQALSRIDLVTTNGQSALFFLHLSTLILPSVIPEVLPFAIAIAVAQTLISMNADSELVVINAAGSPRSTVMRPLLLLAMLASIASYATSNLIDPLARLEFRTMIGAARADLISYVLQEGTFQEIEDGLFVQIAGRQPGGDLSGIFVADSRNEGVDLVYYAKSGSVVDLGLAKILVMRDGMIQREVATGEVSVVRFQTYGFDLSQFTAGANSISMLPKDRSLGFLLDPDPNDPVFQRIPGEFRAELHGRLAEWTLPLVFALIALAVAGDARSHRESRVNPLITVVVLALVVRWLAFMAHDRAERQPVFIWAIYAVPLFVSLFVAAMIRANRHLELPVGLVEAIGSAFGRILRLPLWPGQRGRRADAPARRS